MKRFLPLLLAFPALAAVEGTVTNVTTGKAQAGDTVTLINLGNGMKTVASVKSDAAGKFRFENDLEPGSPHLIQSLHQGVTYNRMLPPGSAAGGIKVEVYDASTKSDGASVTQHMILLEPSGTDLSVNETIIYTNSGATTFNNPEGTLQFFVPASVTAPVRVVVQSPQGMPVQRPAEKGKEPNTWWIKAPIKPGETRIDLTYSMPAADPSMFSSRIFHGGGPVRIVVPQGVQLQGAAVQNVGTHPQTQATIYEVRGAQYAVNVQGTGSLRAAMSQRQGAEGGEPGSASGEDSGPGIDSAKPLIYRRVYWVLAFSLGMLAVGFVLLYRTA